MQAVSKKMPLVAVWPLREGLHGFNHFGNQVILGAYQKGFMSQEQADAAHKAGTVQLMVQCPPGALIQPPVMKEDSSEDKPVKRPRGRPPKAGYSRADVRAKKA